MNNKVIVTLYTTKGDASLSMTGEQVIELATMLQTETEPIPLLTQYEQHHVVGLMIQGRMFTKYPRVIAVVDKEDTE